ncbi:MAG: hypothetical protein AAGC54_04175 [Cyanobacteria bacterium P01_F01_bin.4]
MLNNVDAFPDYAKDLNSEDQTVEQLTYHKLKEASADYLRGDITEEQLEKLEEDLATDYGEAALDMASPARALWSGFLSIIRRKKD